MEWKGFYTLRKKLTIYTFCAEIIGGILYTIQLYPYIGDAAFIYGDYAIYFQLL